MLIGIAHTEDIIAFQEITLWIANCDLGLTFCCAEEDEATVYVCEVRNFGSLGNTKTASSLFLAWKVRGEENERTSVTAW